MATAPQEHTPAQVPPMLSVVINTHSEGRLVWPTLISVAEALRACQAEGITSELIIVADSAGESMKLELSRWQSSVDNAASLKILDIDVKDVSLARNAGANEAVGTYVAFCDGDDLVSENYFLQSIEALKNAEVESIVHPEYLFSFGQKDTVWIVLPSVGGNFTYTDLVEFNLWPSSSVALRSTYIANPYRTMPATDGYGPEDWEWNIRTISHGVAHIIAKDTTFFYRTRSLGGVNNGHAFSLPLPFDFATLRTAMPSQVESESTIPRVFVRQQFHGLYTLIKPLAAPLVNRFPHLANRTYLFGRRVYATLLGLKPSDLFSDRSLSSAIEKAAPLGLSTTILASMMKASWQEPQISRLAFDLDRIPRYRPAGTAYAEVLEGLIDQLAGKCDAIIAVPWVGIGGADLVSVNYMQALREILPETRKISVLSTGDPRKNLPHMIPEGVNFVQIDSRFAAFDSAQQRRLLASAILAVGPTTVISVNSFEFVDAMRDFGKQIAAASRVFFTFFSFDRVGLGYPVQPAITGPREFLDHVSGFFTDNLQIATKLQNIIGKSEDFFHLHYQPAFGKLTPLTSAPGALEPQRKAASDPIRLIWPHRLDKEKRPEVLVKIALAAREKGIKLEIHVFGSAVLSGGQAALLRKFSKAGIIYRGPYSDGLASLPLAEFDAMLLTSESEGMPLVVLQAMLLDLPVIATRVGGLPEIIVNRETGFLTDGPDDVDGFLDAIEFLHEFPQHLEKIAASAKKFATARHSWSSFVDEVRKSLGDPVV